MSRGVKQHVIQARGRKEQHKKKQKRLSLCISLLTLFPKCCYSVPLVPVPLGCLFHKGRQVWTYQRQLSQPSVPFPSSFSLSRSRSRLHPLPSPPVMNNRHTLFLILLKSNKLQRLPLHSLPNVTHLKHNSLKEPSHTS